MPASVKSCLIAEPEVLQPLASLQDDPLTRLVTLHALGAGEAVSRAILDAADCLFIQVDPDVPGSIDRIAKVRQAKPGLPVVGAGRPHREVGRVVADEVVILAGPEPGLTVSAANEARPTKRSLVRVWTTRTACPASWKARICRSLSLGTSEPRRRPNTIRSSAFTSACDKACAGLRSCVAKRRPSPLPRPPLNHGSPF